MLYGPHTGGIITGALKLLGLRNAAAEGSLGFKKALGDHGLIENNLAVVRAIDEGLSEGGAVQLR